MGLPDATFLREQILLAAAGDEAAFDRLMRALYRPLMDFALRQTGRRADAEDAVQEAAVRIHRSLASYRPDLPASPWLYRIVANECHRVVGRRREESAIDADLLPSRPEWDPAERRQFWDTWYAALGAMGPGARTAFILREMEGWDDPAIAELLGISPVTVRRHVMEARNRLKKALSAWA